MQSARRVAGMLAAPFVRAGEAYSRAAAARPFQVGVLTTGIKTSAADFFAQMVMERKSLEDFDWKRQAAFSIFGFVYLGGFQYFFYTKVLVDITAPLTARMGHIASAPLKTFIDQAFHHPFMYFPSFYFLKYYLIQGESPQVAYDRYSDELLTNCQALWKIWVPAQLLNFSVVPIHLQIPYVAGVSFVWTVILSMMRGAFDEDSQLGGHADEVETDGKGLPVDVSVSHHSSSLATPGAAEPAMSRADATHTSPVATSGHSVAAVLEEPRPAFNAAHAGQAVQAASVLEVPHASQAGPAATASVEVHGNSADVAAHNDAGAAAPEPSAGPEGSRAMSSSSHDGDVDSLLASGATSVWKAGGALSVYSMGSGMLGRISGELAARVDADGLAARGCGVQGTFVECYGLPCGRGGVLPLSLTGLLAVVKDVGSR